MAGNARNVNARSFLLVLHSAKFSSLKTLASSEIIVFRKCLLIEENRKLMKIVSKKKSKYYELENSKCWVCNNY